MTKVDRKTLESLVCPETHAVLTYDAERQELQRLIADGETVLEPEGLARRVITDRAHTQQTSDSTTLLEALAVATSTPASPTPPVELALRVLPNPIRRDARAPSAGVRRKAGLITRRARASDVSCL